MFGNDFLLLSLSINKYSSNTQLCPKTLNFQVIPRLSSPPRPFAEPNSPQSPQGKGSTSVRARRKTKKRGKAKIQIGREEQCKQAVSGVVCRSAASTQPGHCRIADAEASITRVASGDHLLCSSTRIADRTTRSMRSCVVRYMAFNVDV